MQRDTIYKRKEGVKIRRLGIDLMLYDEVNDKVHTLNETGTFLWELIDGKNNLLEIEKIFTKQFPEIQVEEILKDIKETTEKLLSEGLITYT